MNHSDHPQNPAPFKNDEIHKFPYLMTEAEVIAYLRIAEVSNAKNLSNVIENLKRMHDFPRIHLCHKALYPLKAVQEWIDKNTTK